MIENIDKYIIPFLISFILLIGIKEKVKVFDSFSEGVVEGLHTILNLFPTLMALFLSVNLLRASGLIDFLADRCMYIFDFFGIPKELTGLVLLKPVSGSASIVIGTELINKYGPKSIITLIACTIMGSTETTLYTLAVYTGEIKKKISLKLLLFAILGNFLAVCISSFICKLYFN